MLVSAALIESANGAGPLNGDEMPNGNGSFDPIASYARLSERVENQGRDIVDLRSNMNTGFSNIQSSIKHLSDAMASSGKTQWPLIWSAIGVSFAVLSVIGGFVMSGVNKEQDRQERALVEMRMTALPVNSFADFKATYENNRVVSRTEYLDKFSTMNGRMDKISDQLVPRQELDRVFEGYSQRFSDMQRQVDDGRNALGSTYSLRDYIGRLTERLDMLEQRALRPPS